MSQKSGLRSQQLCILFALSLAAALTACGGGGSSGSSGASVVAPAITAQPSSVSVTEGQVATFSVTATGTAPLSYQWQKGGSAISGATASTYTISDAALADSG